MKLAVITDTHFGVRNDNLKILGHQRRFFEEVFFPRLEKEKIDTILHLGDLFDRRKYMNFNTLFTAKRFFLNELRDRGITMHIIAGNHDVYFRNTNEINSLSLLLAEYDNIHVYEHEPKRLTFGDCDIIMVPWLAPANYDVCMDVIRNERATVLAGHFEIHGCEMMRGRVCDHGLPAELFRQYEFVWSGHFHRPSKHDNIEYIGTPYEMTWTDYDDVKGFHIFDTVKLKKTKVKNPNSIFHKLIYEDADLTADDIHALDLSVFRDAYVKIIVKNKTNPYLFEMFLEHVNSAEATDVKVVDDLLDLNSIAEAGEFDDTKSTKEIMCDFVGQIETSVDKDSILHVLDNLYDEAQNL